MNMWKSHLKCVQRKLDIAGTAIEMHLCCFSRLNALFKFPLLTLIKIDNGSLMSENVGNLILSLETILNDSLLKISRLPRQLNDSRDTLNNLNLPAFLYKCDTIKLLK